VPLDDDRKGNLCVSLATNQCSLFAADSSTDVEATLQQMEAALARVVVEKKQQRDM